MFKSGNYIGILSAHQTTVVSCRTDCTCRACFRNVPHYFAVVMLNEVFVIVLYQGHK